MAEIKLNFFTNGEEHRLKKQVFAHILSDKHRYGLSWNHTKYTIYIDNLPHGEGNIAEDFTGFGCDAEQDSEPKMVKEHSPDRQE